MPDSRLTEAKRALRDKDRAYARTLIKDVLNEDASNDQAWVLLALATENREQSLACLRRAAEINPANDRVFKMIDHLETLHTTSTRPQELPVSPEEEALGEEFSASKIFLSLIALVVCIICAMSFASNPPTTRTARPTRRVTPVPVVREVTYRVEGVVLGGRVSLTMQNAEGGTEQTTASLPYERTLRMRPGSFSYISVQNRGSSGHLSCEILVDGEPFKKSTSSGGYAIATCSGIVN